MMPIGEGTAATGGPAGRRDGEGPARHARPAPIATPRLVLRQPRPGDVDAIAEGLADYAVAKMLTRVPRPYHRQDARDWLARIADEESRTSALAITRADDRLIGVVSLAGALAGPRLGYWLARGHWNRGFMSEAVAAMLAHHFAARPEARVRSAVMADNPASLRLQEKLGFAVIGCGQAYSAARGRAVTIIETAVDRHRFTPM